MIMRKKFLSTFFVTLMCSTSRFLSHHTKSKWRSRIFYYWRYFINRSIFFLRHFQEVINFIHDRIDKNHYCPPPLNRNAFNLSMTWSNFFSNCISSLWYLLSPKLNLNLCIDAKRSMGKGRSMEKEETDTRTPIFLDHYSWDASDNTRSNTNTLVLNLHPIQLFSLIDHDGFVPFNSQKLLHLKPVVEIRARL